VRETAAGRHAAPVNRKWFPPWLAACLVIAALAVVNVVDDKVQHATLVAGPVLAVVLPLTGRLAGLSWADLGLHRSTWRHGLRWAGIIIGLAAAVIAAGAALPLTRHAFRDSRYHLGLGGALWESLVLIPVGTVLLEEIAFRSALWGLLRKAYGTAAATVVSSLLFGLWHALPSLGLASSNEAVTATVGSGRSAQVITVAATMAFTACAGVVFCELRRRSGSVLAPAGLHWAVNGLSVLGSAAVWAWGTR
jgi:membrane protease YdiL (CAAX protease family)